jgi:hypothetical protein
MGQQTREHRSQQAGQNDTYRGDEITLAALFQVCFSRRHVRFLPDMATLPTAKSLVTLPWRGRVDRIGRSLASSDAVGVG